MIKFKETISTLSDIRFGFYTQSEQRGDIPYLQVRQFDDQGILREEANEFIKLDNKSESHLLKDGDVLFVGKGNRLFAWCYRETAGPYVASSIFFVLRPNQQIIYPEYLAAVLNVPQTKAAFQQIGAGTNIFSIRKSELGAFVIKLPTMQKQRTIAGVAALYEQEIALTNNLLEQKKKLYTGIIAKLIQ